MAANRIYTRYLKKTKGTKLMRVMTLAYNVTYDSQTTVNFSAVVWSRSTPGDNWRKADARNWAFERLQSQPITMTFSQVPDPKLLGYHNYRRLEHALTIWIYQHGLQSTTTVGDDSVFASEMTPLEQANQGAFEQTLPRCTCCNAVYRSWKKADNCMTSHKWNSDGTTTTGVTTCPPSDTTRSSGNIFTSQVNVSPQMEEFLGIPNGQTVSRTQVNSAVISYIYDNCQPAGFVITPDDTLSKLLDYPAYQERVKQGQVVWRRRNHETREMQDVVETNDRLTFSVCQHLLAKHFNVEKDSDVILPHIVDAELSANTPITKEPTFLEYVYNRIFG